MNAQVESELCQSSHLPDVGIYALKDERSLAGSRHHRARRAARRTGFQARPRLAVIRVGRIHRLHGFDMAELLDDRGDVMIVLPASEARQAVAASADR